MLNIDNTTIAYFHSKPATAVLSIQRNSRP